MARTPKGDWHQSRVLALHGDYTLDALALNTPTLSERRLVIRELGYLWISRATHWPAADAVEESIPPNGFSVGDSVVYKATSGQWLPGIVTFRSELIYNVRSRPEVRTPSVSCSEPAKGDVISPAAASAGWVDVLQQLGVPVQMLDSDGCWRNKEVLKVWPDLTRDVVDVDGHVDVKVPSSRLAPEDAVVDRHKRWSQYQEGEHVYVGNGWHMAPAHAQVVGITDLTKELYRVRLQPIGEEMEVTVHDMTRVDPTSRPWKFEPGSNVWWHAPRWTLRWWWSVFRGREGRWAATVVTQNWPKEPVCPKRALLSRLTLKLGDKPPPVSPKQLYTVALAHLTQSTGPLVETDEDALSRRDDVDADSWQASFSLGMLAMFGLIEVFQAPPAVEFDAGDDILWLNDQGMWTPGTIARVYNNFFTNSTYDISPRNPGVPKGVVRLGTPFLSESRLHASRIAPIDADVVPGKPYNHWRKKTEWQWRKQVHRDFHS